MTWAIVLFAVAAVCALIVGVCYWTIEVGFDAEWPGEPHPHEWELLVTMSLCVVACPASLIGGILLCVF